MPPPGYYLVHSLDLGPLLFDEDDGSRPTRAGRERLSRVFRHRSRQLEDLYLSYSDLGTAVVLQPVPEAGSEDAARRHYHDEALFDDLYGRMLTTVREGLGQEIEDAEFSFFLALRDEADVEVEWDYVRLDASDVEAFRLFLDAVYIYQLCRSVDGLLRSLEGEYQRDLPRIRLLSEYTGSLFVVTRPAQYLVSGTRIEAMQRYYETWRLGSYIEVLQERFDHAVSGIAFYRGEAERRREVLMNVLLAVIAVLSFREGIEVFRALGLHFSPAWADLALLVVAGLMLAWAVGVYVVGDLVRKLAFRRKNQKLSNVLERLPTPGAEAEDGA